MKNMILSNGVEMPPIVMGTFPLQGAAMNIAVDSALSSGYRAFDTAYGYGNDDSLGDSLRQHLKKHGLKRSDIFITTKIGDRLNNGWPTGSYFYDSKSSKTKDTHSIIDAQIQSALQNLKIDYIDLLLIHYPYPDFFIEIWDYLETYYTKGIARAIGVSNFRERHLEKIFKFCKIIPMVNQVEHHPLNTRKTLMGYCQKRNIQIEAYSPLLIINQKLTKCAKLNDLAKKYSKSIHQIIIRWNIQLGVIPIPKSSNPSRLLENINVFDFELTKDDMIVVDSLNEDYALLPESINCPGY